MTDALTALILALVPAAGATIGNQSLLTAIRTRQPGVSDEEYWEARDALIAEGVLGKGRGRGGSVYRIDGEPVGDADEAGAEPAENAGGVDDDSGDDGSDESDDDGDEDDVTEDDNIEEGGEVFTLTHTVAEPVTMRRRGTAGVKRKARAKPADGAQVVSYRHLDKRVNNPEVGMVHPENDPDAPKTTWAFDPHLDPALQFDIGRARIEKLIDDALDSGNQDRMRDALLELKRLQEPYLTWTGKAERTSFEVDTVSLHVHERIDPASILAAVRKRLKSKAGTTERPVQMSLFEAPFESLPLRQALDFYRHEKNWSNRLIAGDSLLVMNSLIHKESMAGQVQMIYIDPPYGIKYGSNFQPFTGKRKVEDKKDSDLTQEPEMIKAFRDTWELGIHSYLTYLRDRITLAHSLLLASGNIFVQISDENVHHVRELLDEVFGSSNFISEVAYKTTSSLGGDFIGKSFDYVVWYAKDKGKAKCTNLFRSRGYEDDVGGRYSRVEVQDASRRVMTSLERKDISVLPTGSRIYRHDNLTSQSGTDTSAYQPVDKVWGPRLDTRTGRGSRGQRSWRWAVSATGMDTSNLG